jgi:hypothetical protein
MARSSITGRNGQSILEYLLVISLVVAALAAVRLRVRDATRTIMENAAAHVESAASITSLPGASSSGGAYDGPCDNNPSTPIPPCPPVSY